MDRDTLHIPHRFEGRVLDDHGARGLAVDGGSQATLQRTLGSEPFPHAVDSQPFPLPEDQSANRSAEVCHVNGGAVLHSAQLQRSVHDKGAPCLRIIAIQRRPQLTVKRHNWQRDHLALLEIQSRPLLDLWTRETPLKRMNCTAALQTMSSPSYHTA